LSTLAGLVSLACFLAGYSDKQAAKPAVGQRPADELKILPQIARFLQLRRQKHCAAAFPGGQHPANPDFLTNLASCHSAYSIVQKETVLMKICDLELQVICV
jgi:hypothetical protein